MSINSDPVNLFIPHEHYKFEIDLAKNTEVQKVLPSSKLKGTLLALASLVSLVAGAILSSPVAIAALFAATVTLPVALPIALVSFGVLTLALAIYFFTKKSTVVEQEELPVKFLAEKHYGEITSIKFDSGHTKEENIENAKLNLEAILFQAEFRVDPLAYIAKWKELRGEMKELKLEEDLLLKFFTSEAVQKYLSLSFTNVEPSATLQPFIPHKHYNWSIVSNDRVDKFTLEHFHHVGNRLNANIRTEFGSNLFAIVTQKDFLASPLGYIAQWKKSRDGKEVQDNEDELLSAFESENVQAYLAENFTPKAV